ncbi:MAG: AmmeMemoRadiSam system protein B [Lachnospiraceae bacterium]|nr:AmmeMemoRadiSam system protein B [Lachnospiraceae bacterium]
MPITAGYMVPHPPIAVKEIGRGEELKITDTLVSFDEVAKDIASVKPDTIILTSPHSVMYGDYFHISPGKKATGDFGRFGAGSVKFCADYDEELALQIAKECDKEGIPAGTLGEKDPALDHGTTVPLYFINKRYTDYKLVRIGLSGLDLNTHYEFGEAIRKAVDRTGRKCVFVASGDLSHCQKEDGPYGFSPEGPVYDEKIMSVMGAADFGALTSFDENLLDKAMECGHRSFTIMGGAFDGVNLDTRELSHEATFGVGYGFCIYHPLPYSEV